MFLPSRFKLKYLGWVFVFILIFPFFKDTFIHLFRGASRNMMFSANKTSAPLAALQKRNVALTLKLEELRQLKVENEKLREALGLTQSGDFNVYYAKVWGFSPSSWRRIAFITIEEGTQLRQDDLVINENGFLVGKILEIFDDYATVALLNDPYFSLPVFIEHKGMGLLQGTLGGELKISYIEAQQGVKPGDRVWVSSPKYPSSIYVAKITDVKRSKDELFLDVEATSLANINFVREVFLIQ